MGEVYTNQTFYDMMENENPVLEELKLRMGYTVARKTEVQREILKIHERIATEVFVPLVYPIDYELKVPKYTYEPENEYQEGRFRFVSTWWLELHLLLSRRSETQAQFQFLQNWIFIFHHVVERLVSIYLSHGGQNSGEITSL